MANLLNWLGNGAKRLENTVNNDVVQPVQRDVVAPIQRTAPQVIHNVFSGSSPYSIPNVASGAYNGFLRGENNLGQSLVRYPLEIAATLKNPSIHANTTFHFTPREQLLTGSAPVQSVQAIARSNYQGAKQGNHPGLAGVGTGALTAFHLAQDFGPPGLKAVKLTKDVVDSTKTIQTANTARGISSELGAVGKNVKLSPDEIKNLQKQGFDQKTISKMAGQQGEKVSAPPPTRVPGSPKIPKSKGNIIPQLYSENRVTRLTSLANRLNQLGDGGKGALQTIRDKEIGARVHTQQLADMARPFFKLSPEEQTAAIKVHKGEFSSELPQVNAGAKALKTMFQEAHQRAVGAKIKVGDQGPNYFPQSYPREWFKNPKSINKAAQELVAQGKAPDLETAISKLNRIKIEGSVNPGVYGHFKPRTTDIPGIENASTVTNYIRGSSDAIASAEHFGPTNRILLNHISTAIKKGEDATALRGIVSNYLHPPQPGAGALSTGLNAYQKSLRVVQLPRAAVSHAPQGLANTASDLGYRNYFKAMGQKIKMTPQDEKFLNDNGFRSEKVAPPEGLAGKATAPGLGGLLQFHRDVAALGGRNMALGAAERGDIQSLKNMAVSGKLIKGADGKIQLTKAQQAQAGHFEANKSIGSSSRLESPSWTQTEGGKLIGMYRKMYTFKQAERISNWLQEARKGNPGPLIRYLGIGVPVSGLAVAAAKDEIKNPGSNPLKDKGKLTLDTLHNSGVGSIGYGAVDSGINALTHNYGNDSRWSNAANAVSPGLGFAVQTGQNISKVAHGNSAPLVREGLRMSPVGGTYLANKYAPSAPSVKADTTGKAPDTPQQRKANAKAEATALDNNPNVGNSSYLTQLSDGRYAYWVDGDSKPSYTQDKRTAQNALAEASLKSSGQSYKIVGDTVYRKSTDGTIAPTPKIKFDYQVGTATLIAQKNAGDINGWLATAKTQMENITKQLSDPNTDPLDALTLQNDASTLQTNINKYTGYGGFTKPKSGKTSIAKAGFKTAGSSKIAKPSGVKVRTPAAPKFAAKTRKLSVSKIPSSATNRKLS